MILMLIYFDCNDLRAFWGETPQGCWNKFIGEHGADFDRDDLEDMAVTAKFYNNATELSVECSGWTIQFT